MWLQKMFSLQMNHQCYHFICYVQHVCTNTFRFDVENNFSKPSIICTEFCRYWTFNVYRHLFLNTTLTRLQRQELWKMKFTIIALFIAFYAAYGVEAKSVQKPEQKLTGNFYKRFLEAAGLSNPAKTFTWTILNLAIPDFRIWIQTSLGVVRDARHGVSFFKSETHFN